jgi:hypothetical protein
MASTVFFNGRQLTTPATASAINDTAFAPSSPTTGNVLAILGQATGGQPQTALIFDNPADAQAVLLGGDLYTAATKAFNPSNDSSDGVNAPSQIICIRTDEATQATLNLLDANSATAVTLTSNQYGVTANLIAAKLDNGSTTGFKISVQQGSVLYSQDNVARTAFTLSYGGGAGSATVTISNSTLTLDAPSGTAVAAINLSLYPTVLQLVGAINAVPGFGATVTPGSENTASLNGLDYITAVAVPGAGSPYSVLANLQAVVDWFNGNAQNLVTAARVGTIVPVVVNWSYLAGATETPAASGDWANALNLLQTQDVQWLVPLTADESVWAAADAHCQYMSTVAGRERRAFVGPASGTTLAQYLALKGLINSDRTAIVGPGYYDYAQSGALVLQPPYQTAAMVAAGFAGSSPGLPMTNKSFTARGLELNFRNPADTDQLIQAGILCLENTATGYKVVRSVSSWITNNNFNRVEVSCGFATDYVARTVRTALDVLRGSEASPLALSRAIAITDSTLRALAVPAPSGPGVIVGDKNSPAYQNITASIVNDAITVQFQCSPVIPLNFVLVPISIVPYSGTASA